MTNAEAGEKNQSLWVADAKNIDTTRSCEV